MFRWLLALGGVVALAWPAAASGQVCRRVCRAGEVRDANRCCVKRGQVKPRRGTGSLRMEADVRRASVRVGRRRYRGRLPVTLRRLPRGNHAVVIRAKGKVWRGGVEIRAGKTARLFASVDKGEWPSRAGDVRKARRILDAALAAKGGAARLRKLRSIEYFGKTSPQGVTWAGATHKLWWVAPGKVHWRWIQKVGAIVGTSDMVITPLVRWTASAGAGSRYVKSGQPAQGDIDALWQWPDLILLRHKQPGTRVALLPPARIDGRRADVVQIATAKGKHRARLYINRTTKMVVRIQAINEFGNFSPATELSHYRRVAGIAFAHRWHYHNMWIDWQRVGINQPLPDTLFVQPKAMRAKTADKQVKIRETLRWVQRSPHLVDLDGDGKLDVLGACWYHRSETRPSGKQKIVRGSYVCAVGGDKPVERWRIGPFKQKLQVSPVVAGRFAVIRRMGGGHSVMDIYGLRRRRRLARVRLSDKVKRQCVGPQRRRLWLELDDNKHRVVDMRTGRARRADHSSWCRPARSGCPTGRRTARCATSAERNRLDKVSGFYARFALVAHEGTRLGIGYKWPGTRVPIVVAYDRMGRMYWRHRGFKHATPSYTTAVDAAGGAVFLAYQSIKGGTRMAKLSLSNGKTRWNIKLPLRRVAGLRAAGGRVYLTGDGFAAKLVVVDGKRGAILAEIGYRNRDPRRKTGPFNR